MSILCMEMRGNDMSLSFRTVVVFDAKDLDSESQFWAKLLGGVVLKEDTWHSLIDESGQWTMGFQLNPSHVRPEWPDGNQQQQIHLDLHTDHPRKMHDEIVSNGGALLQSTKSFDEKEGFQVYSDPAGHPFCVGWGHPSAEEVREIAKNWQ